MNSQLKMIAAEGVNLWEALSLNANLGVSFSKTTYFSKAMMRRYMEWAGSRFDKLLVIVADHLEGYNARVFKNLPADVAFARAAETGKQLRDGYTRAVPPELADRVHVALASELLAKPFCSRAVAVVRKVAAESETLRNDLAASVIRGLRNKIEEARAQGIAIEAPEIEILSNYLIEEIGIITYITHLAPEPYPVLLFPHFVPQVIRNVYLGAYNGAFRSLTSGQPLRSIQLVDSDEECSCGYPHPESLTA